MKDKDKEIQIFNNPEFGEVRTVSIDGEPWFVGRDIALALGYSNTKDALAKHVDDDDKRWGRKTRPHPSKTLWGVTSIQFSSTNPASIALCFRASCRQRRSSNAG